MFALEMITGGIVSMAALSLVLWLGSRRATPPWKRRLQWSAAVSGVVAGAAAGCFALFLATLR